MHHNIGLMGKSVLVKFGLILSTKERMEDPKPCTFINPYRKRKRHNPKNSPSTDNAEETSIPKTDNVEETSIPEIMQHSSNFPLDKALVIKSETLSFV